MADSVVKIANKEKYDEDAIFDRLLDQTFDTTMDSLFNGELSYIDLPRVDVAEMIKSTSFYYVKDLNQYEESFTVEGLSKYKCVIPETSLYTGKTAIFSIFFEL